MINESYLDPDVAYLLGLITIRGTLYESQGDKRIIIEFPYKSLIAKGISTQVDQHDQLDLAVNHVRSRLDELLEADLTVSQSTNAVSFKVRFLRNSLAWRNVCRLVGEKKSYTEFEVPLAVRQAADPAVKKEFIRGVADAGGFIRHSNRYTNGKRRVYIEVNNRNWILPIQVCALLQQDLGVPVQMIQWGHPNVREPNVPEGRGWSKEHQIKIFAEAFSKIGFYVRYKQKLLEEFAAADRQMGVEIPPNCNPNEDLRPIRRPKRRHSGERSVLLPPVLRRKHFDAYWQICLAMGCSQCRGVEDLERVLGQEAEQQDAGEDE